MRDFRWRKSNNNRNPNRKLGFKTKVMTTIQMMYSENNLCPGPSTTEQNMRSCCDLSRYYACDPTCIFARDRYKYIYSRAYSVSPYQPRYIGYAYPKPFIINSRPLGCDEPRRGKSNVE